MLPHTQVGLCRTVRKPTLPPKELEKAVFATDHFRPYLLGQKFTLVTVHSALQWLNSAESKGRLARWIMNLQEYYFDIKYRPGSANGNADALFRLPTAMVDNAKQPNPSCTATITPRYNLQQAQEEDLSRINELKANGLPKPPHFVCARNLTLRTLWHCWESCSPV